MSRIPSPGQLGLHIPSWRSGQEEGINLLLTGTKRIKTICAPTGFGKSDMIVAAAILSGKPTCIVTATRGLQDQYLKDHGHLGLVDIRGRSNYPCDMREEGTCEEGYASNCPLKGTVACSSSAAEFKAATSNIVVTNYRKWTSARRFGTGMQHFTQVIFDEGHESFDALAAAMQVTLHYNEIIEKLKIPFPTPAEALEMVNWKSWACAARVVAEVAMQAALARITGLAQPKTSWVRHYTHMRNLCRRLATISTARASDWIVEETNEGYQFDPIRPGRYVEPALLMRVESAWFVSATIRPKTMYMDGISKEMFEFKEFDSDFDPKRCPIYYVPTMRVDDRNPDKSMLWLKIDQVASRRRDRKGIIQTTSYTYQQGVKESSRFADSMYLNNKGEAPTDLIDLYMEGPPGSILVSPSVGSGYNFKDDLARWQFILKIPFEPPSRIVKAREADDKEYRPYRAMNKLVQQFGRIMRGKKDWGESFIGDEHMEWFKPRYGHLAPASFHGFYKTVRVLPQPPALGSM